MIHTARLALLLVAGLVAPVAAANSTTTIQILFAGDKMPLEGSVVAADRTAATVAIACPPDTPSDECGVPPGGVTVTQGPRTWAVNITMPVVTATKTTLVVQRAACSLDPAANTAACTALDFSDTTSGIVQEAVTSYSTLLIPVTITAGAEKLAAATATTTTTTASAAAPPLAPHAAVLAAAAGLLACVFSP